MATTRKSKEKLRTTKEYAGYADQSEITRSRSKSRFWSHA